MSAGDFLANFIFNSHDAGQTLRDLKDDGSFPPSQWWEGREYFFHAGDMGNREAWYAATA